MKRFTFLKIQCINLHKHRCDSSRTLQNPLLISCLFLLDYYNSGANGGAAAAGTVTEVAAASTTGVTATGTYGSYYQNDGGYSTPSPAPKAPVKKEAKSTFPGPPGVGGGAQGAYQTTPGQSAYNQYGQGYGQGNKTFNQNQAGAGVYPYSTAYPSQVTGSTVASQDYSYDGKMDFRHRGSQVQRNLSCFIKSFTNQLPLP